jgi:hypothetical protein
MRNFDIVKTLPELHTVLENLMQDDEELGNGVTFGMKLTEEGLPEYSKQIMIRGETKEEENTQFTTK